MKKLLSYWSALPLAAVALFLMVFPPACKRDKAMLDKFEGNASAKIAAIQKWWDNRRAASATNGQEILSRIPDSMTVRDYWRGQFQNGLPKWTDARVFTLNGETIYEVPFQFPDNLVLLNDKPDAPPQAYITGKPGASDATRPSRTFLIVKERAGTSPMAEIMCVVLNNSYIKMLDTTSMAYPDVRINQVYPSPNNLADFSGSVKFYDTDGVQLLEEGYVGGALNDYVQYGHCAFPVEPTPGLPTTRMYQVCSWTYVYQQNCAPDAGCTDWVQIGVIFNGCETIVLPDSPPAYLPPTTGGTGGGGGFPAPPVIQQNPPIPNADLCGNYSWKPVGDALYCQIRNLGLTLVPNDPRKMEQTFTLGLTCVHVPKWYVGHGWDITDFVNTAFNRAKQRLLSEVNSGALPPAAAILQPKFEEYMAFYFKYQLHGIVIPENQGGIVFRNGCDGPIPVSQPKWCVPQ